MTNRQIAGRGSKLTIRDVATAAGVSTGTVSRVLNANATVRPDVRRKVQRAIDELGYAPNAVARSMRIRSTHTIGCILREINIPQLAGFVKAAHDVLDDEGFSLVISNSEGREERERELLSRLSSRQADGVMMGPYTPIEGEFEAFLRELDIPIVLIDRAQPPWADAVMADHAGGMRAAVGHLLDLGHRRVALITGERGLYPASERIRGYQEAYAARGLQPDPSLIQAGSFLPGAGFRITSALLGQRNPPTAVISGGIDMLSGVLRAVRGRGLRIPEDVSVIASGHSELAELVTPPIAVIGWDQGEIGRIAAGMLLDRIRNRDVQEAHQVLVPSEFIPRASVGPPRRAP
ncbi:LacI family DNA-binding transcriptional regulator [Bradyrhizobium sp. Arg237L]|uniref:LacI family DNA-binding transcriptional regulator n=1 Tax=Bradyrhizobium sp. Arg237L TaxID=3003352 RepID=UPI00249E0C6C|nr:LacI family DNA-binding transcriptional regulator [Bradyrhizobium sp. Arg237L]MDI4231916.1 LacI family DNA-binding transcriptional regulator [Bradyrhizobium sp. Arg237L]